MSVVFTPSSSSDIIPGDSIEAEWTYTTTVITALGYFTTVYGRELAFRYDVGDALTVYDGFIVTRLLSAPVVTFTVSRPGGWNKQDGTLTVTLDTEDTGFGVDSNSASYTVDPILAPPKLDYSEEGLERMIDQFHGSVNLRLLAQSYLQRAQELEDAAWPVITERGLENMTGDRLDRLGTGIGMKRSGRSDEDFRVAIAAESLVIRSNGTGDELIAIYAALLPGLLPGTDMEFLELAPKTIYIRLVDAPFIVLLPGTAERIAGTLRRAMSAATELLYVYGYYNDDELFTLSSQGATTESDTDTGLANTAQTTGGHLTVTA